LITVAVINQKGGVGKTTTAVNLGAGLARLGKRVLLIDFDPQANLTSHLSMERKSDDATVYDLLRSGSSLADLARPAGEPNLWVVPAGTDLAGVELELAAEIGREVILRDRIEDARKNGQPYDFVFIDCAPSLGLLAINALTAADEALVPIQAEFFALAGMARFIEVKDLIQDRLNDRLRLGGILICMWKGQANLSHEVREEVRRVFGDVLYENVVRQNVKLAEAPSAARTIFDYAPESNGAADYAALTLEFLRRHHEAVPEQAREILLGTETASSEPPAPARVDETGSPAISGGPPAVESHVEP